MNANTTAPQTSNVEIRTPGVSASTRLAALAFSGLMTLAMLMSVNSLATSEPQPELLARINAGTHI